MPGRHLQIIAVIHILLYVLDGYPVRQIVFSLFSLFVYLVRPRSRLPRLPSSPPQIQTRPSLQATQLGRITSIPACRLCIALADLILDLSRLGLAQRIITLVPTPSLAKPNASLSLGILLLPANHISWWSWFIQKHAEDRRNNPAYGRAGRARLAEENKFDKIDQIVFYAVCVWLVPFFVFLSLSEYLRLACLARLEDEVDRCGWVDPWTGTS
jgi:hypothetical protein